MTKTAKTAETAFASINDAIAAFQSKIEVPAAARDFVQRSAATAQERAGNAQAGAMEFTSTVETFATSLVGGYANLTRGLFDAAFANTGHALATVEKMAGAKTANEAMQIQADYVRESARANFERVRDAAETARATVTEGAQKAQAEASKLYSYGQKAA